MVKPAAFYVPVNLDLDIYGDPGRWYVAYFLNLIHWRWCSRRGDEAGFVRLSWKLLTRVIPREMWTEIRRKLTFYEAYPTVVERRASGLGRCRGYRLAEEFRETRRIVCTDARINRRVAKVYSTEPQQQPVHRWLKAKLDLVRFDMELADSILHTLRPTGRKMAATEYRRRLRDYCTRLANGDHTFSVDVYGRVHTLITDLKRELRRCLSVNGQHLVNIDLANSQPLFLGILARQYLAGGRHRKRLLARTFAGTGPPYCVQEVRALAKRAGDDLPSGLRDYLRVCESGGFYEALMTEDQRKQADACDESRQRFKRRFYRVLFGRNRPRNSRFPNLLKARFRQRFALVADVLRELKRKNYRHSSHVLQNYEATLFIHVICGRVRAERPDVALYTIHDSMLTTSDQVAYVRGVIREELARLGVTPTIKETSYEHT